MQDAEIRFEEGREGIIPVGSYLIDAAKRLGALDEANCVETGEHCCKFEISEGSDLLSEITDEERQLLTDDERKKRWRVGCYAKIEKPGVIVAMANKRKETEAEKEAKEEVRNEAYRKEFTELPLEKKIANLAHLEAIALSETLAFVINSPFKVFEKIGDVLAEFGFQKEADEKKRSRPTESKTGEAESPSKNGNASERQTEAQSQQSP